MFKIVYVINLQLRFDLMKFDNYLLLNNSPYFLRIKINYSPVLFDWQEIIFKNLYLFERSFELNFINLYTVLGSTKNILKFEEIRLLKIFGHTRIAFRLFMSFMTMFATKIKGFDKIG